MELRRLSLLVTTLVCASALAASADAGIVATSHTAGAQTLSLRRGAGIAVVALRGSTVGRLHRGRLIVYKPRLSRATIVVWGAEYRRRLPGGRWFYGGTDLSYRVYGGRSRVRVRGSGINQSSAGRGWFALVGSRGTYSKDGRPYRPWPRVLRYFGLGT